MPDERNAMVGEIRHFNRLYTSLIGLLDENLMHSTYSLAEARVLFELGHRAGAVAANPSGEAGFLARAFHLGLGPAASGIARELRLDPAYVTRILRKFAAMGLTELRTDPNDRRQRILSLTARGNSELAALQAAADRDLTRLTAGLADDEAAELSNTLKRVMCLLGDGEIAARPKTLA
ncbi:DNA-binding MarR family transcriptional regulator [Mesorhizobium robiniae]|uniref:DNA-binding MarR family transcriptional regulator n=1 Tax=Mesorhizobium robiniae TaxID=559315 RepID=A0ABV2GVY2_9HYPH